MKLLDSASIETEAFDITAMFGVNGHKNVRQLLENVTRGSLYFRIKENPFHWTTHDPVTSYGAEVFSKEPGFWSFSAKPQLTVRCSSQTFSVYAQDKQPAILELKEKFEHRLQHLYRNKI